MTADTTLVDFFNRTLNADAAQIRIAAINKLDELNTSEHITGISILLSRQDIDPTAIITLLDEEIIIVQDERLKQFGVEVLDTTSIKWRTEVLNGLMSVEDYLDPDHLYDLLHDKLPEVALADVLANLTPYTVDELLIELHSVSSDLIGRLKKVLGAKLDDDNEENYPHLSYISAVGNFLTSMDGERAGTLRTFITTLPKTYDDAMSIKNIMAIYKVSLMRESDLYIRSIMIAILWLISDENQGDHDKASDGIKKLIAMLPIDSAEGIRLYKDAINWVDDIFSKRETA